MCSVGVVDYGMGNLGSVSNAFEAVGVDVSIARHPDELEAFSHVVLPGVGAFADGMGKLEAGGWISALARQVQEKGKPFLGLCLGMHLLATKGEEHGITAGLDWVPGAVAKMVPADPRGRVPHVGWNDVETSASRICRGLAPTETFYFVHSYVFHPEDPTTVVGTCDYYGSFPAIIEQGNIMATQFHPEKSQASGLQILRNFCRVN